MLFPDNVRPTDEEFVNFVIAISAHLGEKGKRIVKLLERPVIKQFKHKTLGEVEKMISVPTHKKKSR